MLRPIHVLALMFVLSLIRPANAQDPADDTPIPIEPHAGFQEQMERLRSGTPETAESEIRKLQRLSKGDLDQAEVVRQLLYWAAKQGEQGIAIFVLLERFNVSAMARVEATAPLLDAEHRALREYALIVLLGALHKPAMDAVPRELASLNYDVIKRYLEKRWKAGEPVPEAFIERLFAGSPAHALLAFVYANSAAKGIRGQRPPENVDVLWSARVVDDFRWSVENHVEELHPDLQPKAIAELEKLSEHKEYWVRLYVAQMMRHHGELRSDKIVERLEKDDHELVRKAIAQEPRQRPMPPAAEK